MARLYQNAVANTNMGFKWYSRKENIAGGVSPARNIDEDEEDDDVSEKYRPQVDWFKKYLESGTYSTLTGKMKEKGDFVTEYLVDEATRKQQGYVESYPTIKEGEYDTGEPSITEEKHAGSKGESTYIKPGSAYEIINDERGTRITIDPDLSDEDAFDVMIHELGHTDKGDMTKSAIIGKLMSEKNPYFLELVSAMAEADPEIKNLLEEENYFKLLKKVDKLYTATPDDLMKEYGISRELAHTVSWAAQPSEVRSELMKLRYQAEKLGIHISTGDFEEFTQEKLDELKKKGLNNLLLNTKEGWDLEFSDEDIIWFMNNVAMGKEENGGEKKQDFTGGEMDKDSALTMKGKIIGGVSA